MEPPPGDCRVLYTNRVDVTPGTALEQVSADLRRIVDADAGLGWTQPERLDLDADPMGDERIEARTRMTRLPGGHIQIVVAHEGLSCAICTRPLMSRERLRVATDVATPDGESHGERMYQLLADVTSDLVVVIDGSGTIRRSNRASVSLLGHSPDTLIGQSFGAFVMPSDRLRLRALGRACIDADASERLPALEVELRHASGDPVAVEIRLARSGARMPELVALVRDLSEWRRVQSRMLQREKLVSLGRMTGGIAHDFNNLLTVILGSVELLELGVTEERDAILHETRSAIERATELTRGLLSFFRARALRPVVFDLNEQIRESFMIWRRTVGEHHPIRLNLDEHALPVRIDRIGLEQAVLNLVLNSRDAMPDGGTITITTRGPRPGSAEATLLQVADEGVGMSDEVRRRAVEPFFTTKAEDAGTGVGLATTHAFIRQSGGDLVIESSPGDGTTVRLDLPAADGNEVVTGTISRQMRWLPRSSGRSPGRALVVENEPTVGRVVARALRLLGFVTVEAASFKRALERLANDPEYNLVVTDLALTDGRGSDLIDVIRERWPATRCLAMTGLDSISLGAGAGPERSGGASSNRNVKLLRKPFSLQELSESIRELLWQVEARSD